MYHGDAQHTGLSRSFPTPTRLAIAAAIKLDAAVYGSPVVAQGITIVGTENDSVYAFDASSHQLWRTNLGSPSPARQRPCGNISPLGITGTPIYDAGTGSDLRRRRDRRLDPTRPGGARPTHSGNVRWRKSVDLPGVDLTVMQQRGALAITGGRVWVPLGALAGDCGDYKGPHRRRAVGWLRGSGSPTTPPTKRGGGMWNPAGATVDSRGRLLGLSANGAAFPGDDYDRTNSVLALSPDAQLVDSFAPLGLGAEQPGRRRPRLPRCCPGRHHVGRIGRQIRARLRPAANLRSAAWAGRSRSRTSACPSAARRSMATWCTSRAPTATERCEWVATERSPSCGTPTRRLPGRRSSGVAGSGHFRSPTERCTRSIRRPVGPPCRSPSES